MDYPSDYSFSPNSSASWNHTESSKVYARYTALFATENRNRELRFILDMTFISDTIFSAGSFSGLYLSYASSFIDFLYAPLPEFCCNSLFQLYILDHFLHIIDIEKAVHI